MELRQARVRANGLEFGYLDAGDGPLALCLHGFPDSAWTYRFLLPALAGAGFHAVAPFMRGYAPTDVAPDGHYYPGAIGSDACALHEALSGDGDAVLIGHDWGAAGAYSAMGERDRWRRLVTMAVPPFGSLASGLFSYAQLKRSFYIWFFQLPLAEGAVSADDLAFIDGLWSDWTGRGYDAAEDAGHVKDCLRAPDNLTAAISYYRDTFGGAATAPEHERFVTASMGVTPIPTLYLHGTEDGALGAEMLGQVDQFFAPESKFELLPGLNHFLHLEQPDQINRLIVDWVTAG